MLEVSVHVRELGWAVIACTLWSAPHFLSAAPLQAMLFSLLTPLSFSQRLCWLFPLLTGRLTRSVSEEKYQSLLKAE